MSDFIDSVESVVNILNTIRGIIPKITSNKSRFVRSDDVNELENQVLMIEQSIFSLKKYEDSLKTEIVNLKKELMGLKNWDSEKKNYELKNIGNGCFVYSHKEGVNIEEIPHWLCATCFQNNKKSHLQKKMNAFDFGIVWHCNACRFQVFLPDNVFP